MAVGGERKMCVKIQNLKNQHSDSATHTKKFTNIFNKSWHFWNSSKKKKKKKKKKRITNERAEGDIENYEST
jgi:hypothetical protein